MTARDLPEGRGRETPSDSDVCEHCGMDPLDRRGEGEGCPRCTPLRECDRPPTGWSCSRAAGHDGPCAATPAASPVSPDLGTLRTMLEGLTNALVDNAMRLGAPDGETRRVRVRDARATLDAALSRLTREAAQTEIDVLEKLHARITRMASEVSLGAAWVGGPLDGAPIYDCYKFGATLVRDAIAAALPRHEEKRDAALPTDGGTTA